MSELHVLVNAKPLVVYATVWFKSRASFLANALIKFECSLYDAQKCMYYEKTNESECMHASALLCMHIAQRYNGIPYKVRSRQ